MKKIHIKTLGCKVNQFESASFNSTFEELGHQIVTSDTASDIVIINTCTVTGKAGAQSRQAIRKAVRQNPEAKIIITGCYAQLSSKELAEMPELQNKSVHIVGNGDKHVLVDAALQEEPVDISVLSAPIEETKEISSLHVRNFSNRTRAYLRIQDGCNSFCTYCIVPFTRGRSRSLPVKEVLNQARVFAKEGHKEIVITGIHVGYYGNDLSDNIDISGILDKLCQSTPDVNYRLSSIEPLEITEQLLDVMAQNINFMPHLHIPLQSGNDEILLRMNRRYSTSRFSEVVGICQDKIKDIAIGLDILAGFPGETDEHFETACSFLEDIDFTYLHVFPYSKRPGTPAAKFDAQVEKSIKDTRVRYLMELSEKKKNIYYQKFLNTTRTVLVEGRRDSSGKLKGFTDNYIPVAFDGDDSLKNSLVNIRLENVLETQVSGSVIME